MHVVGTEARRRREILLHDVNGFVVIDMLRRIECDTYIIAVCDLLSFKSLLLRSALAVGADNAAPKKVEVLESMIVSELASMRKKPRLSTETVCSTNSSHPSNCSGARSRWTESFSN